MVESQFVEFKLDYSKTKNQYAIGEFVVASNVISAGGRIWSIVCYPSGMNPPERSGFGMYLSLGVVALGNPINAAIRTIFTAIPIGTDGAPSSYHGKCTSQVTHTGTDAAFMGWFKFMMRSDVESGHLVDGCVTFLCGIVALDVDDDRISVPGSDLGIHLGRLLDLDCADDNDGGSSSDVSFSVGGETFRAHRAVLAARSPVFRAQLFGAMAEARMDRITLHGVQPAAFRILLRFMYTDELSMGDGSEIDGSSLSTELLQDLLAAADMYHLDRMKLMCAQKLWDRVSVETLAATLGCADTHNCPELKKKCIDFVMVDKNFKEVALTKGYLQLMQSFPSVIDEIRARVQ